MRLPKVPGPDRRASARYPVTLEIRYAASDHANSVEKGSGRISDLSSSGLHFSADRALAPGLCLDLVIDWPLRHNRRVQLQLIAVGVVVWSSGTNTALRLQRHEFRTLGVGRSGAASR